MKSFTDFMAGIMLAVLLVTSFVLGGLLMLGANKDSAKAGYIEINQKLYRLVPAEAKPIEQTQQAFCCPQQ